MILIPAALWMWILFARNLLDAKMQEMISFLNKNKYLLFWSLEGQSRFTNTTNNKQKVFCGTCYAIIMLMFSVS